MAHEQYDFVILGGGIVGTAIAWQLLEIDTKLNILLAEKKDIGAGSTSRSAAAFRHQFSSRGNILLSRASYDVYKDFAERFDTDPHVFRENGYLLLYTKPELFEQARERALLQQQLGVPTEILQSSDIEAKTGQVGFFDLEAIKGATWCERDGFLDPLLVAQNFFKAARSLGLNYRNSEVLSLIMDGDNCRGVNFADGAVHAGAVINASGWLSNKLLDQHSLTMPILPVKRYLYITTPVRGTDVTGLPMVVCDLEPYMRPEAGNALLMGWDALPHVPSADSLKAEFNYDELEQAQDQIDPDFTNDEYGLEIRVKMAEVVPLLESDQLRLYQETCGYYQITADEKPILDWDPRAKNLLHAVGFSGHGVMHAPAAARAIAGLALKAEHLPGFEPEAFALEPLLAGQDRPDPEHMSI